VSFDFNVSYSSCSGYSLINTLKLKKKNCILFKYITKRTIVEKGKLKITNFSGDEVQETGKIKRKEDLGTRVGERPVGRACSVHEGSMLMKNRSRQAFGQRVGDFEGTPTLV